MLVNGIDFAYAYPESDKGSVHIVLLSGVYKDVVYKYGKIGFKEESNSEVSLHYNFTVIESTGKDLEEDNNFKHYIGDILVQIITQNMDLPDDTHEIGTNDTELIG